MSFNIEVQGGSSVRLTTAGKYCDRDIVVTATGGGNVEPVIEPLEVTENGTYTAPDGVDGYSPVTVNVKASGGGGTTEEWFNDGNTHIWISRHEGRTSPMLGLCVNGTATIDWGDGTTPDVLTGTNSTPNSANTKYTPNHEYASAGDYIIRITVDGSAALAGVSTANLYTAILRHSSTADVRNVTYGESIKKVELGTKIVGISTYCFNACHALTRVYFPKKLNTFGQYAFYNNYSLEEVNIPEGSTGVPASLFYNCNSLTKMVVPQSVTTVGSSAFSGCRGMRICDFSQHAAVPSLSNANAFANIPADCEIRVPAALYDEWIAATNWSTYASQIFGVGIDDGGGHGGAE